MKIKLRRQKIACLLIFLFIAVNSYTEEIAVMVYNLYNYFVAGDGLSPLKSDFSKEAVIKTTKAGDPDILIALELGREKSFDNFIQNLKKEGLDYEFKKRIQGEDDRRHIALLSKIQPKEFHDRKDLKYRIRVKGSDSHDEIGAQRSFIHAIFEFENNYRLHVLGAHLKSRVTHHRYHQTDMRRYEARLLRDIVNDILEKEKNANILVVGDLNDTYDSEPIRLLRGDKKEPEMRLYDLRPVDKWNLSWTYWWHQNDSYSRVDYALASYALLPEIDQKKSYIVHLPELWMFASDHRPLLITINMEEKELLSDESLNEKYPALPEKINDTEEQTQGSQ